jgi:hypothetical protein
MADRWWQNKPSERYWLEATDREDIGADLKAPNADASGRGNWRYTLFRETSPVSGRRSLGVLPGTRSNAGMERTPDGKFGRPRTAEKTLAFHSKESMCVSAGGRRRRLQNLRPGEHADPGLVSVRDADGPGLQAPRVKS